MGSPLRFLGGRGVPSLDDALINLELRPVHEALRRALDPAIVHMLVEAAEVPQTPGANVQKKPATKAQNAFQERAWYAFAELLTTALPGYAKFSGTRAGVYATEPTEMAPVLRKLLRAATRLPALEGLFPEKWNAPARRVIPNDHPEVPSTALWGPVLAWCLLEVLAESIDPENWYQIALELFDRLRLREPLAQAFHALGLEEEDGWMGAARVKVLLLIESGVGAKTPPKPETAETAEATETVEALAAAEGENAKGQATAEDLIVPPGLWSDPDVCWLTGAHIAGDHTYLVREQYEGLLWWLALPRLLVLAESAAPHRADAAIILDDISKALVTLEGAGYRLDEVLDPKPAEAAEPADTEPSEQETLEPQEPVAAKPVGAKEPDSPPEE